MALRRDAITQISELTQHSEDEALSPAEVEELIGDNGYNVVPGMVTSPSNSSYLRFLAASTTPSEVLGHLYDTSWGDPDLRLLDDLWDLQASPLGGVPNPPGRRDGFRGLTPAAPHPSPPRPCCRVRWETG